MNPERRQDISKSHETSDEVNDSSNEENEVYEEPPIVVGETESASAISTETFYPTRLSQSETFEDSTTRLSCVCNRGNSAVDRCHYCGKDTNAKSLRSGESSDRILVEEQTVTSSVNSLEAPLARGMESVPPFQETSSVGQVSSTTKSADVGSSAGSPVFRGGSVPVEGFADLSVLYPCTPKQLSLFVLKKDDQPLNILTFSVYCVEQSRQAKTSLIVKRLEQHLHTRLQLVPCGDEYSSQEENKHFHPLNLDNEIKIKFELRKKVQRRFRLQEEEEIFQVPLIRIMSLSQNRIPGPIVQVHVEPLCVPGEVCEDHLRMKLDCGRTIQNILIPIWSARPPESA